MIMKIGYRYNRKHWEAFFWLAAIVALATSNPATEGHYALCLFSHLGFEQCPGCGMGHAIGWIFHGDLAASWHAHPLGTLALAVLLYRIFTLLKNDVIRTKQQ